jgi:DtxR family Mn-dependent transcriptional regulator
VVTRSVPDAHREYLQTIFALEESGVEPIQARIADWLGVSRASVSEMIRKLGAEGMVKADGDGAIRLTSDGRSVAEVIVRRHRLAERFLAEVLRLPWVKVHAEAAVWEHVISEDVERAMWSVMDDPGTCPHGNPIPGSGFVPPPTRPIATVPTGEACVLERISEELELDEEMLAFLDDAGLRPGVEIRITGRTPHDVLTISAGDSDPVGLGPFAADRLFVVDESAD